jgi:hypothetical protein
VRYLDKLVDELAAGKKMEKILTQVAAFYQNQNFIGLKSENSSRIL